MTEVDMIFTLGSVLMVVFALVMSGSTQQCRNRLRVSPLAHPIGSGPAGGLRELQGSKYMCGPSTISL